MKVVVVGGFGVGKTTYVAAATESGGFFTEAVMTQASATVDDLSAIKDKSTTTVSMDWGKTILVSKEGTRITLFLFGVPGQERFRFMWDSLVQGALGGVVLLDTRRPDDCWDAIEHLEREEVPFVVAVNCFPDAPQFPPDEIRESLQLASTVPVVECDARDKDSSINVLVVLMRYLLRLSDQRSRREHGSGAAASLS